MPTVYQGRDWPGELEFDGLVRGASLQPPVVGGFRNGAGEFLGDDTDAGLPIRARFRWTHDGNDSARWEQAFSWDGGGSWETNWTMEFTRADISA